MKREYKSLSTVKPYANTHSTKRLLSHSGRWFWNMRSSDFVLRLGDGKSEGAHSRCKKKARHAGLSLTVYILALE
jgi:hypothetical protein